MLDQLPTALAKITETLGPITDLFKGSNAASSLGTLLSGIFSWSTTVLGALGSLALVIFGGIYLAANPQIYREGFVKLVPKTLHPNVTTVLDDIGEALRRWILGQVVVRAMVGGLTGIGLWLAGVPSPFALGFMTGLAEFVPTIGGCCCSGSNPSDRQRPG